MVKTKVQDLAKEFGITPAELLPVVRDMGVTVRGASSALDDGQVAAIRVRWEREKRRAAAPAKAKKGTRKRKAATPEPEPAPPPARPGRRRRTAADVAEAEAAAQAEAALAAEEAMAFERERVVPFETEPSLEAAAKPSIEERAKALFKDLPPREIEEPTAAEEAVPPGAPEADASAPSSAAPVEPPAPAEDETTTETKPRKPFIPPRVRRPPGGPRPVFSSASPVPPRTPRATPDRPAAPAKGGGRKKGRKSRRPDVDQDAVQANILKTLAGMRGSGPRRRGRSDEPTYREMMAGRAAEEKELERTRIRVNEFISVSELAEIMKIPASQIVQFAFKELGLMVTMNQRLDFDQIELMASAFGFEAVREDEYMADVTPAEVEDEGELVPRSPVVTIMGHVDHGKTSLLDHIRKASIVAGEAGGITQHIGAYHVDLPGGRAVTFLDTPGHEAFTAMRARGAQVTDLVVLVVAADDQVMPQTVEAISHAKNAGVPLVVAINKIDLPSANIAKVKQDLLQHSVVLEEFGGKVLSAELSAKTGKGVETLLDQILLQAEILDLKAGTTGSAHGTVLEATLDPGKGPLATILVQRGTLRTGENFICGRYSGRVRALFDERGNTVEQVGPSLPVQVLGFEGVPLAGDIFTVVADAAQAREIAQKRQRLEREAQNRRSTRGGTLEDISRALQAGEISNLPIIIKADQGGPAEALADALAQLSTPEVQVDVVHRGVGAISESDIVLAKASGAIILGFHVRPDANARAAAERESVDVRTYRVIYEAVEDVRKALEGLLKPVEKESILGEAEVLEIFKISRIGTIAGSIVREGTISRTAKLRVVRDGVPVYTGRPSSLKRFKDDVKEVREGLECGIGIENFNDIKVGDRIEAFVVEEVKRTLEASAASDG